MSDNSSLIKMLRQSAQSDADDGEYDVREHIEWLAADALQTYNRSLTEDEVDAALCIWEHSLSSQAQGREDVFDWLRGGEGSCSARQQALDLAKDCHKSYQIAADLGYDTSFDWDFVPRWVELAMSITEVHELTPRWVDYLGMVIYNEFRLEH